MSAVDWNTRKRIKSLIREWMHFHDFDASTDSSGNRVLWSIEGDIGSSCGFHFMSLDDGDSWCHHNSECGTDLVDFACPSAGAMSHRRRTTPVTAHVPATFARCRPGFASGESPGAAADPPSSPMPRSASSPAPPSSRANQTPAAARPSTTVPRIANVRP